MLSRYKIHIAGIGVVIWFGLSLYSPTMSVVNFVVSVTAAIGFLLLLVPRFRRARAESLGLGRYSAITLGALLLSLFASSLSTRAVDKHESTVRAEQQRLNYDRTKASVTRLQKEVGNPVAAFEIAASAAGASVADLGTKSRVDEIRTLAKPIMDKHRSNFVQHYTDSASERHKSGDLHAALELAKKAARESTEKSEAARLVEKIQRSIAQKNADAALQEFSERFDADVKAATGLTKNGQYVAAENVYQSLATAIDSLESEHSSHVKMGNMTKKVRQALARLKPRAEKQRRREAKEQEELAALNKKCGKRPAPSVFGGGFGAVKTYVEASAHDPNSVQISDCTVPILTEESCWVSDCSVRANNGFGAKVLQRFRFSMFSINGQTKVHSSKPIR